jgi:hypothetical protein
MAPASISCRATTGGPGQSLQETVFDPDLKQGGNINIVVHRDPAIKDTSRVLVHR